MEIVWSRLGERLFKSVLEYVEYNFGENVARQTFRRITEKVEQLKYFPGIGVKDFELAESLGFGTGVEVRHNRCGGTSFGIAAQYCLLSDRR